MNKKLIAKAAGIVALGILPLQVEANSVPITGGLSMSGGFQALDVNGAVTHDMTQAEKLLFGIPGDPNNTITLTTVSATSGSFTSVAFGSAVTLATPLNVHPAEIPAGPLWSVGGYTFTVTDFTASLDVGTRSIILKGVGTLHTDNLAPGGDTYADTAGAWTATFNSSVASFNWSSSTGATTPVPDSGSTLMLMAFVMTGLGMLAHVRFGKVS